MVVETREIMPKLNVPYISQKDTETAERYGRKGCGLTATRMVLAYHGVDLSLSALDELIAKTGAYTEETGWIHSGLVDIGRGVGLNGFRINYSMLEPGDLERAQKAFKKEGASEEELEKFAESFRFAAENGAIEDLSRLIDIGIPVITSMEKSYANTLATHMIVLIGHQDNQFIVQDPWDFGPEHSLSFDEFDKHWTKRAIVITQ